MDTWEKKSEWTKKGATMSDKSARKQYGLTPEEIRKAISKGLLQARVHSMHGSPWLRLLRREVEAFVSKKHGAAELKTRKDSTEEKQIKTELRQLHKRQTALQSRLGELESNKGH